MIFKNMFISGAGGLRVSRLRKHKRNELLWVGSEIKAWSHGKIANKAAMLLKRYFSFPRDNNS